MPVGDFIERAPSARRRIVHRLPDGVLVVPRRRRAGRRYVVGAALAIARWRASRPRLCFALSTLLYLSYATACRTFLSFQWDNLLLECGLLASFLPPGPPARRSRTSCSGCCCSSCTSSPASPSGSRRSHDWQDGSAMTFYYETAPLPTWLALVRAPPAGGGTTSRAARTLVLELVVPFAIFGPRTAAPLGARRCSPAFRSSTSPPPTTASSATSRSRCTSSCSTTRRRARRARAWRGSRASCPARAAASARAPPRHGGAAPSRPGARQGRVRRRGGVHRRVAAAGGCSASPREPRPVVFDDRAARAATGASASSTPTTCSADHARAHRARIPDAATTDGRDLDRARLCATSRATRRARPTSSRRTSRASISSSGSTASPSSAARRPTWPCCSSGCARIRRRCGRSSARRCPQHPDAVRMVFWRYSFTTPRAARDRRLVAARSALARTRAVPPVAIPIPPIPVAKMRTASSARCS